MKKHTVLEAAGRRCSNGGAAAGAENIPAHQIRDQSSRNGAISDDKLQNSIKRRDQIQCGSKMQDQFFWGGKTLFSRDRVGSRTGERKGNAELGVEDRQEKDTAQLLSKDRLTETKRESSGLSEEIR